MSAPVAPLFLPRTQIPPPLSNNPLSYPQKPANSYKIACYNVRSLKDCSSKTNLYCFRKYIEAEDPDIMIICESGWENADSADELYYLHPRYPYRYWRTGAAILSKFRSVSVQYGFEGAFSRIQEDAEHRCITLEFENVVLIGTYVPNSGKEGQFKERRQDFNTAFRSHISSITKPIVWGGDFNVIPQVEDLEKPQECWNKMPGCMDWEREEHGLLLEETGFVDAWKVGANLLVLVDSHESVRYGKWRLDSFLLSPQLKSKIISCDIRHEVNAHFPNASDHWPCALVMESQL